MKADNRGKGSRSAVWTPLFFSLVLIAGMVLGFNLRDSLRNKRDIATIIKRNDRLEELIDLIREKYVDTVNTNLLYQDAVTGILEPLDPHTIYIPAEDLQGINDDLDGAFSGIGVEFSIVHDTVEVTSVTEGGPAAKSGVKNGDQLIKVDDSVVAGIGITSERIMSLLRGRAHTMVSMTIRSMATTTNKAVKVTRDVVPLLSVDASIMLDKKTGYIKINRFSATTYAEFSKALRQLQADGASQLILDLRDNPGGYLDAATSISDDFLKDNQLIVSTRGRNTMQTDYNAKTGGAFETGKLAILLNEGSASASEVLAGAIQDWDRGVIVGRRSYGKGLVQEQYEMPDGAALRLTIARYYTPSGRSIQRSFTEGKDAYHEDLEKRLNAGELTGNNRIRPADTTSYFTVGRRVVYGGGGISPDIYVPYDTSTWSAHLADMAFSDEMRVAIRDYFVHNRTTLRFRNVDDFIQSFSGEKQVIASYIALLPITDQKSVLERIASPGNHKYFEKQIKAQLARYLFHDNGYYSVKMKDDRAVNKALAAFNGAQYSLLLAENRPVAAKQAK